MEQLELFTPARGIAKNRVNIWYAHTLTRVGTLSQYAEESRPERFIYYNNNV